MRTPSPSRLEPARRQVGLHRHRGDPPAPHLQLHRFQPSGATWTERRPALCAPARGAGRSGPGDPARAPRTPWATCSWLRQSGLEAAILKHAAAGDAGGRASAAAIRCWAAPSPTRMGWREAATLAGHGPAARRHGVLAAEKTRTRVTGTFRRAAACSPAWRACPSTGYEIHMGRHRPGRTAAPLARLRRRTGRPRRTAWLRQRLGQLCPRHFRQAGARQPRWSTALLPREGPGPLRRAQWTGGPIRSEQYDKLARRRCAESLDMERIYRILEERG